MAKTKKIFSLTKFLETTAQEKADGIITQQDIDFALTSWANALVGKTLEEINLEQNGDNNALKPEWFVEEEVIE